MVACEIKSTHVLKMDIEGATSMESLLSDPMGQQQMPADNQCGQLPPMAPPLNTSTQEVNPGSIAVTQTQDKKEKTKKYSKEELQRLALYVLVAVAAVSLPAVQEKLANYIPMIQGGGMGAIFVNAALSAAIFYAILVFI